MYIFCPKCCEALPCKSALLGSYTLFYKQHFYKHRQAEIDKKSNNPKQQSKAKLLTFENYLHSSSALSAKSNRAYSKK